MKRLKVEILIHYLLFDITEPIYPVNVIYMFCHENLFEKNSNFALIFKYLKVKLKVD